MATLVRKERRPIWVALTIGFAAIAVAGTWLGVRARGNALDEGTAAATNAARERVAPLIAGRSPAEPLAGRHARRLREQVEHALAPAGEFITGRIFSVDGRVLLDGRDPDAGATVDDVTALVADAADSGGAGTVREGRFTGYARIATPQGARVVELTAADGRFIARTPWAPAVPLAALLGLASLAMTAFTVRLAPVGGERPQLYRPAIPRRSQATAAPTDVLPEVSVFAVGDPELEIRHDGADEDEEAPLRNRLPFHDALA